MIRKVSTTSTTDEPLRRRRKGSFGERVQTCVSQGFIQCRDYEFENSERDQGVTLGGCWIGCKYSIGGKEWV